MIIRFEPCPSAKHKDLFKSNNHKNPRYLLYLKQFIFKLHPLSSVLTSLMFSVNCNAYGGDDKSTHCSTNSWVLITP